MELNIIHFVELFGNVLYYFLSFSFIVSVLTFVHEFGHYIVAKICKVKVETFSIGFGPGICGFNDRSGTRWKFSAIPLGGYVKMLGEVTQQQELADEEKVLAFCTKPRYQKAAIVFAGPFSNIIFTVITFIILFSRIGYHHIPPVIGSIVENGAAEHAGLLPDDVITQIEGHKIRSFRDISRIMMLFPEQKIEIGYKRDNVEYKAILTPLKIKVRDDFGNIIEIDSIGIGSIGEVGFMQSSFLDTIAMSIIETYYAMYTTLKNIKHLVDRKIGIDKISGPIKIAHYSGQSVKMGVNMVLYIMAMISINLAVFNLLPIPLLDGGHLFHYAIEAIIRKDLSIEYQKYAAIFGASIILLLIIFTTFNDFKYVLNKI